MQTTSSPTSSEHSLWSRANAPLAAWLGVTAVLVAIAFAGTATRGDADTRDILFRYEFALGSVVVYGLLVALTWFFARWFGDAPAALGLRRFPLRWLWITIGLTVLAVLVSAGLEPLLGAGEEQGLAPREWREDRAAAFALNALVVVLVVPFAEELFFRGLGVRVLGFLGGIAAVGGTALAFALAHGLLVAIPALGFFGLALGWVRYRTASVWPGYIAHAAYNGVGILVALYFALEDGAPSEALAALPFP